MNQFKACVDAIRHKGLQEAAEVVDLLAAAKPKLFAAVTTTENESGDCNGFAVDQPRVFLKRKSAKEDCVRQTCHLLRTLPMTDLLDRFDMNGHQINAEHFRLETERVLGVARHYPGSSDRYWDDPVYQEPLVPADASDEQTMEIAKLLKFKFFKVVSIPCDVNLQTPPGAIAPPEPVQTITEPTSHSGATQPLERKSMLSFLRNWWT